jgi:integrase
MGRTVHKNFSTELQVKAIVQQKTGAVHFCSRPLPTFERASGSLGLRVSPQSGRASWLLQYRFAGRQRKYTLGTYPGISLKDAHATATSLLQQIDAGNDPNDKRKQERLAETLDECFDLYMERHALPMKKASSVDGDRILYNAHLRKQLGSMKLADIRRKNIINRLLAIAKTSPISANRVQSLISVIFTVAVDHEIVEANPCYRMPKVAQERSRDRVLTDEELVKIWDATSRLTPVMRDIFRLRLLTAQRGAEVCSMRWEDIDTDGKIWTIPADITKNGRSHRVPLTEQMLDIIERQDRRTKYLFPASRGNVQHVTNLGKAREKLVRLSAVADFTPHDLRRTAATLMAEKCNVSEFDISLVLNHSRQGITQVYNRAQYDNEKRRALQKWNDLLDRILGKVPAIEKKIVPLRRSANGA